MGDISTAGIQPLILTDASAYISLESVHDPLKYLDHDIIMKGDYAFLNRENISLSDSDLPADKKQYYANGLLVTGLLEEFSNDEYDVVEKKFEAIIATITNLLLRKLDNHKLSSSHFVFIHKDDYGDIVIGFMKKHDNWSEYNDKTGYFKICSSS